MSIQNLRNQVEAFLIHSYNDIGGSTQNTIHAFIDFLEHHAVAPVEAAYEELVGEVKALVFPEPELPAVEVAQEAPAVEETQEAPSK